MEDRRGIAKTIDIETNNLLADMLDFSSFPYKLKPTAKLWCVVIRDVYTDEIFCAEKEQITKEWLKENLKGCKYLIHQNGIKFDLISLFLFGILEYTVGYLGQPDTLFGEETQMWDTLIVSRLLNPDRPGGHSLKEWGIRTGLNKIDFRQLCINKGYISKDAPKGAEFAQYVPEMCTYCIGDTEVTKNTFFALLEEMGDYKGWNQAIKLENKLADLAIRRESLGFWFDKDLAIKCVEDLTQKMEELQNRVNPILPPKPMGKTELGNFTPPATQFLKNGKPSSHIVKFAQRIGGFIEESVEGEDTLGYFINFEGERLELPYTLPLKTHIEADISNLDHVKMTLIDDYGWVPSEWRERDLTKDSKKQNLPYEKRVKALERWVKDTFEGKYKKSRLEIIGEKSAEQILEKYKKQLEQDRPVRVPTSPTIRVGVEKELCPNLVKLGDKVDFARDFALFLTYKHRKASIAGGEIDDMDFDLETPNTGYLSMYREVDGRVPTPAIEIGASSNRYRHIGVTNVARASSIYGKEMRSLFGAGADGVQLGYDFASVEARIQGHYCWKYTGGEELSKNLLAEKPNDIHTLTALRLGLDRTSAKSINYMLLFGGQIPKVEKMLSIDKTRATEIYNGFWDSMPALKDLKVNVEKYWENNGKDHLPGIDGRLIRTRSKHSLINSIFQSGAVICAKYVNVISMQYLENVGIKIDPFVSQPSVCEMIAYHDECQLFVKKDLLNFETFETKEDAEEFVKNYKGGNQLSAINEGKVWYICLPNILSKAVEYAIEETQKILKLNVDLGYEWTVGRNWYDCH